MYLERFNLKGRVAVVTGGARGIGFACVEALAEAGAHVYIADMDMKVAGEARDAIKAKGHSADIIEMDVTKSAEVDACAERIMAEKGRVDVLVCNAGIARSEVPAEDVTDERWLNVLDVNLNGAFWCCRAFGRPMLAAGRGSIVTIGSMSGFIVNKPQAQAYYNASKAGRASPDEVAGGRMGRARRARQFRRADLHQHANDRLREEQQGDVRHLDGDDADGAARRAGRDRFRRSLPCLRRFEPADGLDRGRGRRLYVLVTERGVQRGSRIEG